MGFNINVTKEKVFIVVVLLLVTTAYAARRVNENQIININVDLNVTQQINQTVINNTGVFGWQSGANILYNDTANIRVGIGTSAPTQTLTVVGSINATTSAIVSSNIVANSTGLYFLNSTGGCMGRLTSNSSHFIIQSC